jgi:hypothetical protein
MADQKLSSITNVQASMQNAQNSIKFITESGSNLQKNINGIASLFERRIKRRERIVKRTNLLLSRREERKKREEIEAVLESKSVNPKISIPGSKFMGSASGNFLSRILKFAGYATLGWIINNFPTWEKNGKLLISTLYGLGNGIRNFPTNILRIFQSVGKVLNAYKENILSLDFLDSNNRVQLATKELQESVKNLQTSFERDTSMFPDLEKQLEEESGEEGEGTGYSEGSIPDAVKEDTEFTEGVTELAKKYNVPEDYLYAVMNFETGGTFNPAEKNKAGSGATGLIQFMPDTAKALGTTTDDLAKMSRSEQLKYVDKYFSDKGIEGGSLSDVYMSVLFPAAVGKSDDFVLFGEGAMSGYTGEAYDQNKGLDLDGDGRITKAEASSKVVELLPKQTPTAMTPVLKKGTFIQGNTGESRGPHFHIGPETEVYGKPEGKVAARDAAFKASKGLIAKNEFFSFTNANIDIDPKNPPSDEQLKKFIEREQAAHASRSGGGSFGGIDIAGREGLRFPLAVSDVEDKGDGFGVSGTISGTKAFVGHGEPSSTSTPQDAQISSQTSESSAESVTPERKGQTVIVANSGGGDQQTPTAAPSASSGGTNIVQDAASMLNSFVKNQLLVNLSWT